MCWRRERWVRECRQEGKRLQRKVLEREKEDKSGAGRERETRRGRIWGHRKDQASRRSRGGERRGFSLCRLESDRSANRVASDDGPAGECRLCQWSGTNGAREGMQLPALEEGYCGTGQGGLTQSQDGGLKGREGGTQASERRPC